MLLVVRNPLANSRDMRRNFDPWVGKIFAGGNVNPYQYSCLENSMDRGAWWATIHGVTKSWTRLSDLTTTSAAIRIRLGYFSH